MPLGGIGWSEMLLVGMIVLMVFGPRRLPEVSRSLGRAMREFKRGMNEIQRELEAADEERSGPRMRGSTAAARPFDPPGNTIHGPPEGSTAATTVSGPATPESETAAPSTPSDEAGVPGEAAAEPDPNQSELFGSEV